MRNSWKLNKNYLLIGAMCILILSSCSKYQYVSISSYLQSNENKDFFCENDTIKLKYSFSGENFRMKITVFNKLQQPIFIDWAKSSVIINEEAAEYPFQEEQIAKYVAPQSYYTFSTNSFLDQFITIEPNDSTANLGSFVKGENGKWEKHSFGESISPIFFTNILAITTHEDLTSTRYFENSFWVSEILQTPTSPSSITNLQNNQFYIRKPTGFGNFMGYSVSLAVILILAILNQGE